MTDPRPSVLVVDDDASLRLLCRVNLELEGFDVREASTVDEARTAVADARPDVVLLDVHLGSDHSTDLLDELRADGIPVVLVTGSADASEYARRADAVVSKPFQPDTLVAMTKRLVVR